MAKKASARRTCTATQSPEVASVNVQVRKEDTWEVAKGVAWSVVGTAAMAAVVTATVIGVGELMGKSVGGSTPVVAGALPLGSTIL